MLTVLSFGAGQDSTAIFYKIIYDREFASTYWDGELLVIFSDTGNEHAHTYEHLGYIKTICEHLLNHKKWPIRFIHLEPNDRYHSKAWGSLTGQLKRNSTIVMKGVKSCTDNLKIKPIYRFLDNYCAWRLGHDVPISPSRGKPYIVEYARKYGPIRMLIGFAKGEESRAAKPGGREKWWGSIKKEYPLIDLGMDRMACIEYMKSTGLPVPYPSNCLYCPYISKHELLYLWRFERYEFIKWCRLERTKLKANRGKAKNHGALGALTLIESLRKAVKSIGPISDEDLKAYKFTHGHCIKNSY